MAIAKAGQASYDEWGDEFILSDAFLSADYRTWEGGDVSVNHQNNSHLLNATLYDLDYDAETGLVYASFANLPDKARDLISSEFYEGLSQECLPIKVKGNEVTRGHGLGVTIVTYPWSPAATQGDGVGVPPTTSIRLAASFRKYDHLNLDKNTQQTNSTGEISTAPDPEPTPEPKTATELQSAKSEIAELKSINTRLTSENEALQSKLVDKDTEIQELKSKNSNLEKQATMTQTQIESAVNAALESANRQRIAQQEHDDAAAELKSYMPVDIYNDYLKSDPTTQAIKSMTATLKKSANNQVGSGAGGNPPEQSPYKSGVKMRWNTSTKKYELENGREN
jgi:hypothetical protein